MYAEHEYISAVGDSYGGAYGGGLDASINLSGLSDYVIWKDLYLYLPDDYPGMEMGWPWRWWETLTDEERIAIDKVKEEFKEEPLNQTGCKGTNRYGGHPDFKGTGEHIIIQFDYLNQHPGRAEREYSIPHSSLTGSTGYADLVNTQTREIFEIKPANNQIAIANGLTEVKRYVDNACLFCGGGFVLGHNYPERIFPYPGKPDKNMRVRLNQNGLITYQEVPKYEAPVPVPVPESVSQNLKDFFKTLLVFQEISEEMIAYWLRRNPAIKNYIIAAGVGLIVATIVEDFVTLGLGVSDDIPIILLAMRMIRLARTIP